MRLSILVALSLVGSLQAADKNKEQPMTPGGVYRAHDMQRPRPPVITPPGFSTQEKAGAAPSDARVLFDGKDLFAKPILTETFKGLLGIDGVMKPFECIGEIDELRAAYHGAQNRGEYAALPFEVPASEFDDRHEYPSQEWARTLVS